MLCYTFLNLQTFNAVLGATENARSDIARPDNAAPDQTEVDSFFLRHGTLCEFCLWVVIVFFVIYYCTPS